MSSTSPLSAVGSRRIRSSDTPVRPHGTKLRNAAQPAVARRAPRPGRTRRRARRRAGRGPSRSPRSSPPSPRHCAAAASSAANCVASSAECSLHPGGVPLALQPRHRLPYRLHAGAGQREATAGRGSPRRRSPTPSAPPPCRRRAPALPAPITASDQPFVRACRRHASIASGQCSGSPTGLPLARLTEPDHPVRDTPARAVLASPDSHDDRLVAPGREVAERVLAAELAQQRPHPRLVGRVERARVRRRPEQQVRRADDDRRRQQVDDAAHPQRRASHRSPVSTLPRSPTMLSQHEERRGPAVRGSPPTALTSHAPTNTSTAPPTRKNASARQKLPRTRPGANCGRARTATTSTALIRTRPTTFTTSRPPPAPDPVDLREQSHQMTRIHHAARSRRFSATPTLASSAA